ncbi:MFS transporter [Rothia sp. AR01]|uniref:MFS transporter n=1 Tax=Rothia santali TaxID=2949643 RepID=A0A9X2HM60_9MICC|nr:MFS transporter [Rothia santali]MCP3426883.1 MFS transporter [Rothia santali]
MADPASRPLRPATGLSLAAISYVFAVVMMGTTIPTPLYPLYEEKFGFGSATTTILFAVYAGGVILSLVVFGRLSDALGRRPLLLAGVVFSLLSAALFTIGSPEGLLYVGRVLSGLAAGIFTSTGTVCVMENAPEGKGRLAGSLATASNIGGLGLGILMAGLVGAWAASPLLTPYVVHAVLLVVAGLALVAVRERVVPDRSKATVQRPRVPAESRGLFLASVIGAVTGFAICGVYSSVGPNVMGSVLGIHSPAVIGAVVFLVFGSSAVAQIALRGLPDRTLIVAGSFALVVAMALLATAILMASLTLLVASAVLGGVGQGLLFMTGMRAVTEATRPENRTEATTSYFIVGYLAISLPAIGTGELSEAVGLVPASLVFAAVVAAATLLGLVNARRFAPRASGS